METIQEAKDYLYANWEKGTRCPCCNQYVKLYKHSLHYGMARVLIEIYKAEKKGITDANGYIHVENHLVKIGSTIKGVHSKLEWWKLLERKPNIDNPEKHHLGLWRITDQGKLFVENKIVVPKKIHLFNNKFWGHSEETVNIIQALGKHFNYEDLMNDN